MRSIRNACDSVMLRFEQQLKKKGWWRARSGTCLEAEHQTASCRPQLHHCQQHFPLAAGSAMPRPQGNTGSSLAREGNHETWAQGHEIRGPHRVGMGRELWRPVLAWMPRGPAEGALRSLPLDDGRGDTAPAQLRGEGLRRPRPTGRKN